MNLLAFDTSTETMSIAVSRTVGGTAQQWQHTGAGGAQASTTLIAAILDLLQQAQLPMAALDAICFGSGPGSFTGLRTACAVAQGLAFGAKVPVLAVESLLAVAEEARFIALADHATGTVTALLDARMDELYAATYSFDGALWTAVHGAALVRPEALDLSHPTLILAGNVFAVYGDRLVAQAPHDGPQTDTQTDTQTGPDRGPRISALPTAAAMLRLVPQLLAQGRAVPAAHALPTYIRDKVAKTTAERAAEKAAASVQTANAQAHSAGHKAVGSADV
jgi:tRNA threonylcarbamoyladenosine biosynthesis protein TsaB